MVLLHSLLIFREYKMNIELVDVELGIWAWDSGIWAWELKDGIRNSDL